MNRSLILLASISAQSDNLGDIEIRRLVLQRAAESTRQQILWAGKMPDSYVNAFNLPDGIHVFRRPTSFVLAAFKALVSSRVRLVFAPGPVVLSDSLPRLAKQTILLIFAGAVRLGGGHVISVGRAFGGRSILSRRLEQLLSILCLHFSVRDSSSESSLGFSVCRIPDVAFARPIRLPEPAAGRSATAISLRNDSNISLDRLDNYVHELRARGSEPIFVTQVKRDDAFHASLARRYGAEVLRWGEGTHAAQFELVDDTLSRCKYVASNRLHSLIFGLTRGAVPIELRVGSTRKVPDTLGGLSVLGGKVWLGQSPDIDEGNVLGDGSSSLSNEGLPEIITDIQSRVLLALSMVAAAGTDTSKNAIEPEYS